MDDISKVRRLLANNYVRANVPSDPVIERLDKATIKPITQMVLNDVGAVVQDSCVFCSDRSVCKVSLHLAANLSHDNHPGAYPNENQIRDMNGTHLYAVVLIGHFGHFLVESLSRLWAFRELSPRPESVIFVQGWTLLPGSIDQTIPHFAEEIFTSLGISSPVRVMNDPTRVETLMVPSQLFGFHCAPGHPIFRSFVHRLRGLGSPEEVALNKVYVSRSRISRAKAGGILCEDVLEKILSDYGYLIMFPEELPIYKQLEVYNRARHIIFAEGSALHLFGFVCRPEQDVAIINRRPTGLPFAMKQLRHFGSTKVSALDVIDGYVFRDSDRGTPEQQLTAFCKLDFTRLANALQCLGFIPDQRRWRVPTKREFEEHAKLVVSSPGAHAVGRP